MREVDNLKDSDLYLEMRDILRIANQAAMKAKEENKKYGIPKMFARNGIVYFEYDNGEITTEIPEILKKKNAQNNA